MRGASLGKGPRNALVKSPNYKHISTYLTQITSLHIDHHKISIITIQILFLFFLLPNFIYLNIKILIITIL